MAVGNDEMLKEVIKEGDQVISAKFSGDEISLDENDYIILQRNDIGGIVR